jgi:hypothetical protein
MKTHFEQRIASLAEWRAEMIASIEFYRSWLDANGIADIQQSLRIHDLIESLKQDRMTLALIAEFSRGKTELINALLFGHCKRRILPSDAGRTTMCPTELFHDVAQQPFVRLLPIESRRRNETVASLKTKPSQWTEIDLDTDSGAALAETLQVLVQTKTVAKAEAIALGLFDPAASATTTVRTDDPEKVEIPAWRYALINYPHPLLSSGLIVLDTPGLNAPGTESELTMSIIPHAHAALFLVAMDSGVTRSDLDVWHKHVQPRVARRLAVVNKIDLLWDDIKSEDEIQQSMRRQLDDTARLLNLPPGSVLPLSAQKALVARVRGDRALLERSGIEALERMLADQIVPAKQEILRAAVAREIGTLVDASRQVILTRFESMRTEYTNLIEISRKNSSLVEPMLAPLEADRNAYHASLKSFRSALDELAQQGGALLASLSDEALERLINTDREFIENAWTTAGLIENMQGLFNHFTAQADQILKFSKEILALVDSTYAHFHGKAGFEHVSPPSLNLEQHTLAVHQLRQATVEYCRHPRQILTEKHFLVPNFYRCLVAEARTVFEETREDTETWIRMALNPLNAALKEHEIALNKRVENLRALQRNLKSVDARASLLKRELCALKEQNDVLVRIKTNIGALPAAATSVRQHDSLESANDSVAARVSAHAA